MATNKSDILKMVEKMPDIAIEDVMEELYFRKKIDIGLEELDQGKGISDQEIKQRHSKWLNE